MKLLVFLLISLSSICYGGSFEDCFKKAKHRQSYPSIVGVDYIYVINSKKNISVFKQLKKDFAEYDIVPYRFNAVDPKCLTFKTLSKIGVKMVNTRNDFTALRLRRGLLHPRLKAAIMNDGKSVYFGVNMSMKKIARNLDFLSVIYDAYKTKKQCVWVMTDNVEVEQDPTILTNRLTELSMVDPKWDVLYTDINAKLEQGSHEDDVDSFAMGRPDIQFEDLDQYMSRDNVIGNIQGIGLRCGCYSFLVSRHGMKLILDYYHQHHFFIPFDKELLVIPGIHIYGLPDPVVSNDRAL